MFIHGTHLTGSIITHVTDLFPDILVGGLETVNAVINNITGGEEEVIIEYTGTLNITGGEEEIIIEVT